MKKITENTVKDALSGESQAHLKYKLMLSRPEKKICLISPGYLRPLLFPSWSMPVTI